MQTQLLLSSIGKLIDGTCDNPGALLGPHRVDYRGESAIAVRSFLPQASAAWIIDRPEGERRPMRRLHPAGFFEAIIPATPPFGRSRQTFCSPVSTGNHNAIRLPIVSKWLTPLVRQL
jgi:1,4-alpha-glucan branching enzyme